MSNGIGKPKYGNNSNFAKFINLKEPKEGESDIIEFRVLGPIKSCQESGQWAKYHSIHYGFKGRDRKDQTKTRNRTFECVQDRDARSKIVKHECDGCNHIARKTAERDQREAKARVDGKTEDEIKTLLEPYNNWLRQFNVDRKWYINGLTNKDEAAVLKISHRLKKQLDQVIKDLMEKEGIDPLDPDAGVFFEFKRVGRGRDTLDTVSVAKVVTRTPEGKRSETYKEAPLTAEQQKRLVDSCPDLNEVTTKLTDDQISRLVQCGNDPDVVDAIFDGSQPRVNPESKRAAETKPEPVKTKPAAATAPAPVAEPVVDDEEAAAMRALEAIKAKKAAAAAKAAETPKPAVTATTTPADSGPGDDVDPNDLSDEEFMSAFGASAAQPQQA